MGQDNLKEINISSFITSAESSANDLKELILQYIKIYNQFIDDTKNDKYEQLLKSNENKNAIKELNSLTKITTNQK